MKIFKYKNSYPPFIFLYFLLPLLASLADILKSHFSPILNFLKISFPFSEIWGEKL